MCVDFLKQDKEEYWKYIKDKDAFKIKINQYMKEKNKAAPNTKEYFQYIAINDMIEEIRVCEKEIDDLQEMKDESLAQLVQDEITVIEEKIAVVLKNIKEIISEEAEEKDGNALIEIRSGAGGAESSIFVADMLKMYTRYCENKGLKCEIIESSSAQLDGFKSLTLLIKGNNAYSTFKKEGGVHRVQRVPKTEANGRIHTSTVTVAVLPEESVVNVNIDENDLRIDTFRSSGAGGQSVNTTSSAVRITHLPTGLTVEMQDERSQHDNRKRALKILQARLLSMEREKQMKETISTRNSMIGTGERNEKIRTYNYPQNRCTEHRTNLTLYNLDRIMLGDLDKIIESLKNYKEDES
jgi:peptide chain release factor 1